MNSLYSSYNAKILQPLLTTDLFSFWDELNVQFCGIYVQNALGLHNL